MPPAARCRSGSSGPGMSRMLGLPPCSRSAARSLEQLQQEAQASGACASPRSCGSTDEMGAQENHTPGLGPRDSIDHVVTLDAEYVFHVFQMVLRELRIRGNTWKMRGNT